MEDNISYHISYHIISLFSQNMLKIHINKHIKGKIAKRPQETRKRAITQLRKKATSNLPTKETYISHSLQTLHETKSTTHQAHHYPTLAHTPHTRAHSHRNKTKTKHQKQPSSKNQKALHICIIGKKICCPSVAF